jgi:hypothetical protein
MDKAHFARKIGTQYAQREKGVKNTDAVHDGHWGCSFEQDTTQTPIRPLWH